MVKKIFCLIISVILVYSSAYTTFADDTESAMVASGYNHTIALNKYGRVHAAGRNDYGQCNTYSWQNVAAICAGKYFSAALLNDRTVKTTNPAFLTDTWTDVVKIVSGDAFLAALKSDGSVLVAGEFPYDTAFLHGIKDIAATKTHLGALKEDGTCVGFGGLNTANFSSWTDVSRIFGGSNLFVGIKEDGSLIYCGNPTYVDVDDDMVGWSCRDWTDIDSVTMIDGAANSSIVIAVKKDKTIVTDWPSSNNPPAELLAQSGVKQVCAYANGYTTQILVLHDDDTITPIGNADISFTEQSWKDTVSGWQLRKKPLSFDLSNPIISANKNTLLIRLPDGDPLTFGDNILSDISDIKCADFTDYGDNYYIYVDENDEIHSNIDYDFSLWGGMQKVCASTWVGAESRQVSAIRWDGKVFSSNPAETSVSKIQNVSDIGCTQNITAILTEDGQLSAGTARYYDIASFAAGANHFAAVKTNGTCVAFGNKNVRGELNVGDWTDIKAVAAGGNFTVGLKTDGTCVATGLNTQGQCNVSDWHNVEYIYAGYDFTLGYTYDNKIFYTGPDSNAFLNDLKAYNGYFLNHYTKDGNDCFSFEYHNDISPSCNVFAVIYDSNGEVIDIYTSKLSDFDKWESGKSAHSWSFMVFDGMNPIFCRKG